MKELRIAIVDDNRYATDTLKDILEQHGEVILFESCEELLTTGQRFDAVVTDTSLGEGMDGFGCAEEIHKRDPHVVIIGTSMMTPEWAGVRQQTEAEYRTMYQRLGADDFINRADGADTIAKRVLGLLSNRRPST